MFTGMIREIGLVRHVRRLSSGLLFSIEAPETAALLDTGDSVAVDGACQTVVSTTSTGFTAEAVHSTLKKTTLNTLRIGRRVNLEPSLRMGDSLGGHLMQGHVTTRTVLESVSDRGVGRDLFFPLSGPLRGRIHPEGSVAVDGVSLTVSSVEAHRFSVTLIRETRSRTVLSERRAGDEVNIEIDRMAQPFTVELNSVTLKNWGYV